jgi:mono/diheme cytochrome c family protein
VRRVATIVAALLFLACGRDETPAPKSSTPGPTSTPAPTPGPAPTAAPATTAKGDPERGRQVYLAQCTACHNRDPERDGPLGPAVKGSPPELVEARVVRGEYPSGYTPKRPSKVMPARPDLAPETPHLTAYLR